jgi:uncharacterized glyoxalase superfamily protein PhnB
MLSNRSCPTATVIPVLAYPDPGQAAQWLCEAFGFTIRLRIGNHRIQLNVGDGNLIVRERNSRDTTPEPSGSSVMIRVEDAHAHAARAEQHGATILQPPADQPFGERQYSCADFAGHYWTFTQSLADVAPEDWGGESVQV